MTRRTGEDFPGKQKSPLLDSPFDQPCPYLPMPSGNLDYKTLSRHGHERGAAFYLSALEYGQYLWLRGFAARSLLAVDRALLADLPDKDPVLKAWPLPYRAIAWIIHHCPEGTFIGNPRVHYQHLADRVSAPRREQRSSRAWAAWYLTRRVRPELPADPKHDISEPSNETIQKNLQRFGLADEAEVWIEACRLPLVPTGG